VRPAAKSAAPVEEEEETLRALAALGYVGGHAADDGRSFRELADPKDRLALYNRLGRARELAKGEHPGEAAPLLEAILAEDPAVVDAWFTLGNVRFRQRDWEKAETAYRETLARHPDHDGAAIGLADSYLARGRVDEAVAGYRHQLERDPANAQIRYRLAQVLLDSGRDDEADAALVATLAAEPKTARAEVGRAVVAFRRHDLAAAHAALDRAQAIDPRAKWAAYNRALVFEAEGKTAEAMTAYRSEIENGGKSFRPWFNLGQLLDEQGAGALDAFRHAVEANGESGAARFFLAQALLRSGDLAGAEREARKGLQLEPETPLSPLGHFVLADVLNRRGASAEAAIEASKGRALQARFPPRERTIN
jgi:tetratricopeptide (TPR) repeat protein